MNVYIKLFEDKYKHIESSKDLITCLIYTINIIKQYNENSI